MFLRDLIFCGCICFEVFVMSRPKNKNSYQNDKPGEFKIIECYAKIVNYLFIIQLLGVINSIF